MTFSIVGFDPETKDLGVAVQSKFIAVGAIVPWAKAGIGAIATQAFANTSFGTYGLELLQTGKKSPEVLRLLLNQDLLREERQIGIIDSSGEAAAYTGKNCISWAGHIIGNNFSCQGNILIGENTLEAIAKTFENTKGDLADKLLNALRAADQEGKGDIRGQQSAALQIVRKHGGYGGFNDRYIDIRVDDHPEPIKELTRIFELYNITLLSREAEEKLIVIEGEIAERIKLILEQLGYLDKAQRALGWTDAAEQSLKMWFGVNNFENRWREDHKIWSSIYSYIFHKKGIPMIQFRRMNN